MIARRILIHLSALLVGGSLGVVVAGFVHTEFGVDSIFVAIIVAAFIFLSQVLASVLAERVQPPPPPPPRDAQIRGTEPWGWLKPASGIGAGFPLNKECTRLGRGVEMDILLNNASISRRHAQFRRLIDGCLVEDIGSRNGVFVNGTRVTEQTLSDGDQVKLGEMKFIFVRVGRTVELPTRSDSQVRGDAPVRSDSQVRDDNGSARPERGESFRASEVRRRDVRPFDDTSEYSERADSVEDED
jgi:hypothetical protein